MWHLERQTVAGQIEVIVVSDGHDPETADVCQRMINDQSQRKLQSIQFLEVPKSQQGVARNRGVREARGECVMFIGDDIFLAPDACEKHLAIYKIQNSKLETNLNFRNSNFEIVSGFEFGASKGVLGFTTWDPAVGITPVMRWLEQTGWQFGYPMIGHYAHDFIPNNIQHRFTYTSHISLPTEIAKKFPFRDDVTLYGWEDVEWGWRLAKAGVKLFYEPDARALHHHHIAMEESLERMEKLGRSAVAMEKLVPELQLVPRGWKLLKYHAVSLLPGIQGKHALSFLTGLQSGHAI